MPWNVSEGPHAAGAVPLALLRGGDRAVVVDVRGGHGIRRRAAELGLIPGAEIEVCSDAASAGPVIVRVLDSRIALGRGMAPRILVRPV